MHRNERNKDNALEILFAIGGAGAQVGIAIKAARSLATNIKNNEVNFTIVMPPKSSINNDLAAVKMELFENTLNFQIVYSENLTQYFNSFTSLLANCDILWTKPSELTFYSALGIPIIIAPPIGPQEKANSEWLIENQSGIEQLNPDQTNIWLMNMYRSNTLARLAQNGWHAGNRTALYSLIELIDNLQAAKLYEEQLLITKD